jgi:hypothetical protein
VLTARLILGALALLRGLHVIDAGALVAGLVGGTAAAVVAVANAGANELSSILLAFTVFTAVFGLTAGLLTLRRTGTLLRLAGTAPASRMPLAVAALVGRTLVDVGLVGTSLLAGSAIVRWLGADGLVAILAGLVLAIVIFIGLRRLSRSRRVRGLPSLTADRVSGPPTERHQIVDQTVQKDD